MRWLIFTSDTYKKTRNRLFLRIIYFAKLRFPVRNLDCCYKNSGEKINKFFFTRYLIDHVRENAVKKLMKRGRPTEFFLFVITRCFSPTSRESSRDCCQSIARWLPLVPAPAVWFASRCRTRSRVPLRIPTAGQKKEQTRREKAEEQIWCLSLIEVSTYVFVFVSRAYASGWRLDDVGDD